MAVRLAGGSCHVAHKVVFSGVGGTARHRRRRCHCRDLVSVTKGLSGTPHHRRGTIPAGGPSDVVARVVTDHMGKVLGQSLVIENVGGGGGTIGSARVATA